MAEVANHNRQEAGIEQIPQGQEFVPYPDGMVQAETEHGIITVIAGETTDGKKRALVLGVDCPRELFALTAASDSKRSDGFISGLTEGPVGKMTAGICLAIAGATGTGVGLQACAPAADNPNQPTYGTHHGALSLNQILAVGQGEKVPWTVPGEIGERNTSNLVVMNGENYLFIARGGWEALNPQVVYVKCQEVENCLNANANVQELQGLNAAGLGSPYSGPGVFQALNGDNKFMVKPGNSWVQMCDIGNNANGILEVSNCAVVEPGMSTGPSVFNKNGVPHAIWATGSKVKDRNLHTNETVNTAANGYWGNACYPGVEAEDGSAVIAAQMQEIQGDVQCRLVTGINWVEVTANPIDLQSLNQGSKDVEAPRLFGDYILFIRDGELWKVQIPPAPQNPESDADAGSPDADADQPDAIDGPEADNGNQFDADVAQPDADAAQPDAEIAQDTADAAEAVVEPDTGPDTPAPDAELPPDNGPEQDTGPEVDTPDVQQPDTKPDTQNPDTTTDPCDFAKPKLTIPQGCQLENCTDPFVDINGKCTFSVDLGKAKPVTVELDGTYQMDLLEKIGTHLAGKYKVVDSGNQFNTVAGNLLIGVEGTTYSGKFMDGSDYLISCQEGLIKIFLKKLNGQLELLATLDGGEDGTFDLNNPKPLTEPDPESQPETQPEPTPDTGSPQPDSQPEAANDIGSPKLEPASDAGPSQSELQPETKDTTPPPSKPPGSDGGCSTTSENPNAAGHFATIAAALLALGTQIRKRQEQEQQSPKPTSILARTWNRVARSLGLRN